MTSASFALASVAPAPRAADLAVQIGRKRDAGLFFSASVIDTFGL
jgi:hypothetical protein